MSKKNQSKPESKEETLEEQVLPEEQPEPETAAEPEPAPEPETEAPETPPEKTALEKAEASIANLSDRLMRTAAEFDNFKKRTAREKDEVYGMAVCDTLEKLIPVLDNLERAVSAADREDGGSGLLDGVRMVKKQFEEALAGLGAAPIEAVGQPFDPELHNAVMTEESDQPENTVLEEFMKGYRYKDKVIRHSMVKVSN